MGGDDSGGGGGGGGDEPGPSPSPWPSPSPDDGTTEAPTTKTTRTTTTRTTTTLSPMSAPMSAEDAMAMLNTMYLGFDTDDDSSPVGVTMSMAADKHDFSSNLYCADVVDTDCYEGRADCRMSCSLLNHKVMISEHDNGVYAVPGMEREVGYVFNQTLVETYFGKCAMIYDGASMHSYNGGCGRGARGTPNCTDPKSAFFDQCEDHPPAHTCAREDPEVENWMCKCDAAWCADGGYGHLHPPSRNSGPQG